MKKILKLLKKLYIFFNKNIVKIEIIAKELGKDGIMVNGIAPGITVSGIKELDMKKDIAVNSTLDVRTALPEEIAEIGCFLASDSSNHIIGQVIIYDGGETIL